MSSLKPRSILAATDLTEGSDAIVRAAAGVAEAVGAELHVVHAFDLEPGGASPEGAVPSFPDRVAACERRLEEQVRRADPTGRTASRRVEIRVAHRAVLECAQAVSADLIVLGPHRVRPLGDRMLGSTADRVIRSATAPCLVVRGDLRLPLRKLLVPFDFSTHSRAALEVALGWGAALGGAGTRVEVVHVIQSIFNRESDLFEEPEVEPEVEREVRAAATRLPAAQGLDVGVEVVWGDLPAEEILGAAGKGPPDLIVMGTHGYGGVRRALIGSVASAVARRAGESVLLVPPRLPLAEDAVAEASPA